ncbi:MFS transporter [Stygiolobus caldivivus]|uniref:MFS transporter n=1 Tax=Stygiolobus caldivivus TaxID=2824673 RepID=A0A8D5U5Z6_9CREN|nr:MFS transporter [Stygiolobus caldivivus]BCU69486.1 MFS transporter [Stygiolobus caldivivus]
MKIFLGQTFIVAGLTMLSLLYPISLFDETHSTALLGLSITLNNLAVAIGSYVWGVLLDKSRERYLYALLLPLSGLLTSFIIFRTPFGLVGYSLVGFFSALDSPLYSVILLEQIAPEMLVVGNSRLSQLSLAGNITGSLLGALFPHFEVPFVLFGLGALVNSIAIPKYKGDIREDRVERIKEFKVMLKPLISFSMFNLSAEVFYVMFIPLLTIYRLPSWTYFFSYTVLYITDEYVYYKSPQMVRDNELYYTFIIIFLRSSIVLTLGLLVFASINLSFGIMPIFLAFGSSYPLYSTAFFSLMFKNLSKNRGAIIGLFNAGENLASAGGSILSAFVNPHSISQAYFISFFGFVISFFLFYDYITSVKVVSSS